MAEVDEDIQIARGKNLLLEAKADRVVGKVNEAEPRHKVALRVIFSIFILVLFLALNGVTLSLIWFFGVHDVSRMDALCQSKADLTLWKVAIEARHVTPTVIVALISGTVIEVGAAFAAFAFWLYGGRKKPTGAQRKPRKLREKLHQINTP